jgi:hypothetical protein
MAQSGLVKLNDELHEIDGKPVQNLLPEKVETRAVIAVAASTPTDVLAFALPGDGAGQGVGGRELADRPQGPNPAGQVGRCACRLGRVLAKCPLYETPGEILGSVGAPLTKLWALPSRTASRGLGLLSALNLTGDTKSESGPGGRMAGPRATDRTKRRASDTAALRCTHAAHHDHARSRVV